MIVRHVRPVTFALLAGLAAVPAAATSSAFEERLARLERELASLREENNVLREQLGGASRGTTPAAPYVRTAGRQSRFAIGGFSQLNAEFGDAPDARWAGANARDRFLLRRARLGVQGQWSEPVSFKLEADFGNNSIGGRSGYAAQLTDAFATYAAGKAFNVRLGQFKTPFGYEQLTSDTRTHTIERSLPNDRLTLGRQIGLGVFGEASAGRIAYSTGLFNGNGANNGANDNDNFLAAARATFSAVRTRVDGTPVSLAFGLNAHLSRLDAASFSGERRGWGFDAQLAVGSLELNAELLGLSAEPTAGATVRSAGWSLLAAWTIPAAPAWKAVARFESYEADRADAGSRSENLVLGAVYRLMGDDLKLSFNYILGDPAGSPSRQGRFLTSAQLVY